MPTLQMENIKYIINHIFKQSCIDSVNLIDSPAEIDLWHFEICFT